MSTADGRLAVQRVLGYLPQDLGMYPDLSAHEFLDRVAPAQQHRDPPPGAATLGYPAGG
jgi:ABC-type multidrug transport system ATPase subunit